MGQKFSNKVVVVTGASAGLGRAIALAFAKEGAHVGLIARHQGRLLSLKKEIESYGVKTLDIPCDVSQADRLDEAAEAIQNTLGPIDIWVNNAIVTVLSPVRKMLPQEYQ